MTILGVLRGASLVAFLLLQACTQASTRRFQIEESERTLAVDAVQQLRRDLNVGACQHIYESAAQFFRSQASEDWRGQCERLRDTLGTWLTFDASRAIGCTLQNNIRIILIEGLGDFQNGGRRLSALWIVGNGRAELGEMSVAIDANHWLYMPPRRSRRPSFEDPPMFRAPPDRNGGTPRGQFAVAGHAWPGCRSLGSSGQGASRLSSFSGSRFSLASARAVSPTERDRRIRGQTSRYLLITV